MFHARKLKPDRSIGGFIPPLAMLLSFGMTALFFGFPAGFIVVAAFLLLGALYDLYIYIRTGNLGHLVVFAYNIFMAVLLLIARAYIAGTWQPREEWSIAISPA